MLAPVQFQQTVRHLWLHLLATTEAVAPNRTFGAAGVDSGGDGATQKVLVNATSTEGGWPTAIKVSVTLPLLYLSLSYVGSHVMVMDLIRCVLTRGLAMLQQGPVWP